MLQYCDLGHLLRIGPRKNTEISGVSYQTYCCMCRTRFTNIPCAGFLAAALFTFMCAVR